MVKPEVLIISSEFPPGPGGIGQHAYDLARSFQQLGNEVTVMSPADYSKKDEVQLFDAEASFNIIRFPRIGVRTYLKRISITLDFLKSKRDISIFLTGKFSLWIGWFIKKRFPKLKTIAILHGSEVNLKNMTLRKFTHKSIQACDEIVAVSKFTRQLLPEFILGKRIIHIIPNGIHLDALDKPAISQKVILNGEPKLLTVGHVSPRKGQHRVIKAIPELLKKYPNLNYHIVGRPVYEKTFTDLAQSLGVFNHITFHGKLTHHQDLQNFYRQSDVFMLLSENQTNGDVEGFGIVALEANYYGIPVVGAIHCGVEDAVQTGRSGYLANGDSPEDITEAVTMCIKNKEKLRETSRAWSIQHDWDKIIQHYLKLCS